MIYLKSEFSNFVLLFISSKNNLKLTKMAKSIFYHAGCPVCLSAEQEIIALIGEDKVEVVHFGASMADLKG